MKTASRIRQAWNVLRDRGPEPAEILAQALRSSIADQRADISDPVRARQDFGSAFSIDPFTSDADVKAGFRRITSGNMSWNRDLSPLTQDKMIELSWYLYRRNPLATRLIDLTKVYVMGEGMKVQCEDQNVQDWIDAFWDDPVNQFDLLLPEYVRDLGLFGEQ